MKSEELIEILKRFPGRDVSIAGPCCADHCAEPVSGYYVSGEDVTLSGNVKGEVTEQD